MKLCESRGFDTHLEYQSLVDTEQQVFLVFLGDVDFWGPWLPVCGHGDGALALGSPAIFAFWRGRGRGTFISSFVV